MKKITLSILSAAFILGAGTVVFASNSDWDSGFLSFEKMLPIMQEMHPDFSNEELEDMYNTCHGTEYEHNGKTQQTWNLNNRMNRF